MLDFIYDESGKPFALTYTNGSAESVTYYYVLNLQGDVVGLIDASGVWYAQYSYNAWGEITQILGRVDNKLLSMMDSAPDHIANLNPLRYRGYYYDTETGFYYLQSRYYDPVTHRFINADSLASTGQGFTGTNMFAYCGNDPVNNVDPEGKFFKKIIKWVVEEIVEPVTDFVEETMSNIDFTYNNSLSVTGTFFVVNGGGQLSTAIDAQGNVAVQFSPAAGGTASTSPGASVSITSSQMFSNAPTVYNLEGPGVTSSLSVTGPVPYTKIDGTTSFNFHGIPRKEGGHYTGVSLSNGISLPQSAGSVAIEAQYSYTYTLWSFNIYDFLDGIYSEIKGW